MRISDLFDHQLISIRVSSMPKHIKEIIKSYDFETLTTLAVNNSFKIGNYSRSAQSLLNIETSKYACAALESYLNIDSDPLSQKSLSWAMIRTYYSAFFAAHACLRTIGVFVSRLDKLSCDILENESIRTYPSSLRPLVATYKISYSDSNRELSFKQIDSSSGYHDNFWDVYSEFIEVGLNSPKRAQTVYQDELLFVTAIKDNISNNQQNKFSWLSTIRNKVNYELPQELWYPYKSKKKDTFHGRYFDECSVIKSQLIDYKSLASKTEYYRFIATCDAIIDLMIQTVESFFNMNELKNDEYKNNFTLLLKRYNSSKYKLN